jgi:hypothetical protein
MWAAGAAICLAALLAPKPAMAQDFTFHIEPAGALWVDEPQSTRFTPGFYLALRPAISLGRIVSLQLTYAMLLAPAADGFTEDGTAHFLLGGVRVRPLATLRPETEQLGGLFVDFNLGYARTDDLDRFAFDVGLGYGIQVASWLSLGPVIRYGQIVQADDANNQDPNDAQFFTIGLDLAFGAPVETAKEDTHECPDAAECKQLPPPAVIPCPLMPCPDQDHDGVCDAQDRCPTQIGPLATLGCPIDPCTGAPLVVLVQFDYNSAALPLPKDREELMDPMLDSVAAAMAKNPACRVCIVGNASNEGPPERNMELSRERAKAVQGYLTRHGLPQDRMPTTGLGERCQLVPEDTLILNRRVEFRRLEEGQSCPTDCTK